MQMIGPYWIGTVFLNLLTLSKVLITFLKNLNTRLTFLYFAIIMLGHNKVLNQSLFLIINVHLNKTPMPFLKRALNFCTITSSELSTISTNKSTETLYSTYLLNLRLRNLYQKRLLEAFFIVYYWQLLIRPSFRCVILGR